MKISRKKTEYLGNKMVMRPIIIMIVSLSSTDLSSVKQISGPSVIFKTVAPPSGICGT